MSDITLNVETRQGTGTQMAKKLRSQNKIPGIYYFHGSKSIPLSLERTELRSIWGHESGLIEVIFDGKEHKKCVIRDIQFDPIKGTPIHVDFLGIKMTEKLTVRTPITLVGTSIGVKNNGGILQQVVRELEIECLPADIPDHIEIDVTALEIGDSISVSDIVPENYTILADPTTALVTVSAPRIIETEAEVAVEETAEPEVITQRAAEPKQED
ncbi:50S ribosomal protein L25 [candidate division KSB1 bacterium]|nr:50S ribosomal protein L25 [candidate division KSB1 bacterium]RQW10227.1 MAG: 50S ribosomal protein L25 [candidate division KSB1 bacterium]